MSAEEAMYFALQSPVFIPGVVTNTTTKLSLFQSLGWSAWEYLSWLSPVSGHRPCLSHHVEGDGVIVSSLCEWQSLWK